MNPGSPLNPALGYWMNVSLRNSEQLELDFFLCTVAIKKKKGLNVKYSVTLLRAEMSAPKAEYDKF